MKGRKEPVLLPGFPGEAGAVDMSGAGQAQVRSEPVTESGRYGIDIEKVLAIARRAGEKIMEVYNGYDLFVEYKDDGSPLTLADKAAHAFIRDTLKRAYPEIPLLSEEEADAVGYAERKRWRSFWLIDPLDGTKEFVKRNGEFTVNIALIRDGTPVIGVIFAPAGNEMFYAVKGSGSCKVDSRGVKRLRVARHAPGAPLKVAVSRSHANEELDRYVERLRARYDRIECVTRGSSLKFCLVAEGKAQLYPRLGPTMEWDTAAGQVIAEEAGARVFGAETGRVLSYGKRYLRNERFVVESL